jgi:hypothetical protein
MAEADGSNEGFRPHDPHNSAIFSAEGQQSAARVELTQRSAAFALANRARTSQKARTID